MRAGKNNTARKNANSASNVMPTNRNGNEISQTIGHSKNASSASGQHKTSSKHQPMNASMLRRPYCTRLKIQAPET
jgi:hypothetical protein